MAAEWGAEAHVPGDLADEIARMREAVLSACRDGRDPAPPASPPDADPSTALALYLVLRGDLVRG